MAIAFTAAAEDNSPASTTSINPGAGANDVIIDATVTDATNDTTTWPASFRRIAGPQNCTNDNQTLAVGMKSAASGSEGALTTTIATGNNAIGAMVSYSGVDNTAPLCALPVVVNQNTGAVNQEVSGTIQPLVDGSMILCIIAIDVGGSKDCSATISITAGSAGTPVERADVESGFYNLVIIEVPQTTAGSVTLKATTSTGGTAAGVSMALIALRPSGVGTYVETVVAASSDDAQQVAGTVTINGATIGASLDATTDYAGVRFNNVTVPQGATIDEAWLEVVPSGTGEDEPLVTIFGEDADDCGTFTTGASDISSRAQTTASVSWSNTNLLATGGATNYFMTPSIKTIVQEITDRGGWASGNDMAFIIQGGSTATRDLTIVAYDTGPGTSPPRLHISYTAAAGGGTAIVPIVLRQFRSRWL